MAVCASAERDARRPPTRLEINAPGRSFDHASCSICPSSPSRDRLISMASAASYNSARDMQVCVNATLGCEAGDEPEPAPPGSHDQLTGERRAAASTLHRPCRLSASTRPGDYSARSARGQGRRRSRRPESTAPQGKIHRHRLAPTPRPREGIEPPTAGFSVPRGREPEERGFPCPGPTYGALIVAPGCAGIGRFRPLWTQFGLRRGATRGSSTAVPPRPGSRISRAAVVALEREATARSAPRAAASAGPGSRAPRRP